MVEAGLPPPGETVVWEGRPSWWPLARHLCHVRGVAAYVAIVAVGAALATVAQDGDATDAALTVAPLLLAGGLVLGFLTGMAWLVARTTLYTLTTRRLIIRFGIALPATLGIPHAGIARASVALNRDGTGDLLIETRPGFHVAWRRCWPHARPWRFMRAQPMLRSVPQAGLVAAVLARTLAQAGVEARVATTAAAPSSARHPRVTELTPAR